MMMSRLLQAGLFCAVACLGCGAEKREPRTEIMLVIDTNLTVPDQIDEIGIIAVGPNGDEKVAKAQLGDGTPALPRTLGLVHETGPLTPVEVTVVGRIKGNVFLTRKASLAFLKGRTLVLPMHLIAACVDVVCNDAQTCTEGGGCDAVRIDPASLETWTGKKPRLVTEDGGGNESEGGMSMSDAGANDGGAPSDSGSGSSDGGNGSGDSGMCVPNAEICNGLDDDCNDVIDDGFDLNSDPEHCGACNTVCDAPRRLCCAGECKVKC